MKAAKSTAVIKRLAGGTSSGEWAGRQRANGIGKRRQRDLAANETSLSVVAHRACCFSGQTLAMADSVLKLFGYFLWLGGASRATRGCSAQFADRKRLKFLRNR